MPKSCILFALVAQLTSFVYSRPEMSGLSNFSEGLFKGPSINRGQESESSGRGGGRYKNMEVLGQ